MAPSTDTIALEPNVNTNASELSKQPTAKANENGTLSAESTSTQHVPSLTPKQSTTHEQKDFRDILSYEDKWIGWDGPVWCDRYGRFENKEQAAEDDGYKSESLNGHQNPKTNQIHQWGHKGCALEVPSEHRAYVKDIQRRIEPMTASLVALEHQVANLVHRIVKDGEHAAHDAFNHEDGKERFAMHSANGHQADGPMHAWHFDKPNESTAEAIANLEGKVHSLTHQLHVAVKQNDELIRNGQVGPGEHHYWQVPQ